MVFQHMLAYGNSDQASFRNYEVQAAFDVMTVPGTIASYYQDATAAFVLSSQLKYLIDPRTPLFQGALPDPRASHFTLADWHGGTVRSALGAGGAMFDPAFYSPSVIDELVNEVVGRQRDYATHATTVKKKLNRYAKLLAQAMEEQGAPRPSEKVAPPHSVLAPYFAVSEIQDPWWNVVADIWRAVGQMPNPGGVNPVLCLDGRPDMGADGVATLRAALPLLPADLSKTAYFWITNFDERKVHESQLRELWKVVYERPAGRELVNLYGGFFSICMRHAGLSGFGNGLTYSEFRDWPALSSTGAAPPRYYVKELHVFMSPAVAAVLEGEDSQFACGCSACDGWRASGQSIASLPYHDLKRHFALARKWEMDLSVSKTLTELALDLEVSKSLAEKVAARNVVLKSMPNLQFLQRWANVLKTV